MGNWRAMFEQDRGARPNSVPPSSLSGDVPQGETSDDEALKLDSSTYRPWVLQRGRSSSVLMLHLRRYDKSGLWIGWQLAYHSLVAAEYVGSRMLSLDFGSRQFMIEGDGLDELARHLQSGSVLALQEYASGVWPTRETGPVIRSIKRLGRETKKIG